MRPRRFGFSLARLTALGCALTQWCEPAAAVESAAAATPPAPAELPATGLAEALGREVRAVVAKCNTAVCRIEAMDELGPVRGTGFFVDADGTLLTSYSVGGETEDLVVTVGEARYPATRRAADPQSGLAVLKIDAGPMPILKLGRSTELVVGSPVIALGYPLDLDLSASFGLLAGFELGFKGRYFATRHLRANLAVQRGQGGSPILNMRGEAVGVLISTVEGNSGIFALPAEAARKLLRNVREHGRLRPGWLGVDVATAEVPVEGSTARVRSLRADAPGAKGGLKNGDILQQIGDWKITVPADVLSAAFYITAGEPLAVRVAREGKILELRILPEDPPAGVLPVIERGPPDALEVPASPLTIGP